MGVGEATWGEDMRRRDHNVVAAWVALIFLTQALAAVERYLQNVEGWSEEGGGGLLAVSMGVADGWVCWTTK